MPNRVIKESIKFSPEIDSLTWFEECLFTRMIVSADDYGVLDGRVIVLKNELFPTKENVTKTDIEEALMKLLKLGLIESYSVSGRPYIHLTTWGEHQRLRDSKHKYPTPDQADEPISRQLAEIRGNLPQLAAECGLTRARAESESESESNPNPNPTREDAAALMDDREAHRIQMDHNDILNAADEAGFPTNTATRNILTAELYPKYGKEKLLCGIAECVRHGVPKLAYLAKVLEGKPKPSAPPAKVVLAQQYEQRSYDDEDESFDDIMNSMMKM